MKKYDAIRDWIEYARGDLSSATVLYEKNESHANVIFLSHESTEKYFKALIQKQGKEYPFTHSLEILVSVLKLEAKENIRLSNISIILDELYPIARYPEKQKLSKKNAKDALEAAQEAQKIIEKHLW